MVNPSNIEQEFKANVSEQISLLPEGNGRFRVLTPFRFDDGDHFAITLKENGAGWYLSDEGNTFMHLSYDLAEREMQRGTRQQILINALSVFSIEDRNGELVMRIPDQRFGDSLYSYLQGILRITDITLLTRERVRSTFLEDFRAFIEERVPPERREFDWHDPESDPRGNYRVDCRINQMPVPLFVYALTGDDKVRDTTIGIMHYERIKTPFRSVGIFEEQESVNRRALAQISDVIQRQFSSLPANRERIASVLADALQG
jgi:hypothetical protein